MTAKTTKELIRELEDIREGLYVACSKPHSLEFLDLMFIAQQVGDIKKELRLARARGE